MNINQVGRERGIRLRATLNLMQLSRQNIADHHDISSHTLHAWMCGVRTLSEKGAKRLCNIFRQEGWFCTPEWLVTGQGISPTKVENYCEADVTVLTSAVNAKRYLDEDFAIAKEAAFFTSTHSNAQVLMIGDDAMEPLFSTGDYVGGINISPEKFDFLVGQPCIVEVEGVEKALRLVHKGSRPGRYNLQYINIKTKTPNPLLVDCHLKSAAPVIWKRASLSSLMYANMRISEHGRAPDSGY
jgi:hypothetical protein